MHPVHGYGINKLQWACLYMHWTVTFVFLHIIFRIWTKWVSEKLIRLQSFCFKASKWECTKYSHLRRWYTLYSQWQENVVEKYDGEVRNVAIHLQASEREKPGFVAGAFHEEYGKSSGRWNFRGSSIFSSSSSFHLRTFFVRFQPWGLLI